MESNPFIVSEAPASDRVAFFKRTYLHVAGAFAAFGALLYAFFQSGIALSIMKGFGSIMGSMGGFGIHTAHERHEGRGDCRGHGPPSALD